MTTHMDEATRIIESALSDVEDRREKILADLNPLDEERDRLKNALAALNGQGAGASRKPRQRNAGSPAPRGSRAEQIKATLEAQGPMTRKALGEALGTSAKNAATLVGEQLKRDALVLIAREGEADLVALPSQAA